MAKAKKRRRASRKDLVCPLDFRMGKFNPATGKKFKREMCLPRSGNAKPRTPHRIPKPKVIAVDCGAGAKLFAANPNTGKKRPTCVRVLKSGKVKTSAPTKGKRSRAEAVKVSRIIAISGRR